MALIDDTAVDIQNALNEMPVLDFEDISYGDSKRFAILQSKAQKVVQDGDEAGAEKILGEMEIFLCKMIVSIPRSWLVRSAPADLDWSKPDSLNYIKSSKFNELKFLIAGASQRVNAEVADKAGDSPKP